MTEKLFTFCGISDLKGQYKVRFANDEKRVTVLIKGDHHDVRLIPLPEAMTKVNAANYILNVADFEDDVAQTTINEFIDSESAKGLPKVKAAKVVKEVDEDLELNLPDPFVVDALEDEPF